jgi:CheY-like chemotaxis protein
LAHEFNNMLMAIAPFAELIARRPDDPRVAEYAQRIRAAIAHGESITRELLARCAVPPEPMNVAEALQVLASTISPAPEIRTPADPLRASIEREAFRRAAAEVLAFLGGHGRATRLVISAESCLNLRYSTAAGRPAPQQLVHVKFRSEGETLPPETLAAVHDLDAAREAIRPYGSQILIEQADNGTVVHMFLAGHDAFAVDPWPLEGRVVSRVLIVEDDALVADAIGAMLSASDIDHDLVTSAKRVIEAIERSRPEVVLLDIHLADGDGTEVFREIAARWPDLPVIFSTGHGSPIDFAALASRPNVRLLQKPYDADALLATLREVCSGGPRSMGAASR